MRPRFRQSIDVMVQHSSSLLHLCGLSSIVPLILSTPRKSLSSTGKHRSARTWYALEVDIESSAREAVEYALMEAGALGTEAGEELGGMTRITASFEQLPDRELVRAELAEALRIYDLPSSSVRTIELREFADQDWLSEWKKNWLPVEVGRLIIAPPWSEVGR